jgi:hypothetical protein
MSKKKKQSRKDLVTKAASNQKQYDSHQAKIKESPTSLAIDRWKKEKANFLSRYNYYVSKAKVKHHDPIQ